MKAIAVYVIIARCLAWMAFPILFLGFWAFCIGHAGFIIGILLGWIPALIAAICLANLIGCMWGFCVIGVLYAVPAIAGVAMMAGGLFAAAWITERAVVSLRS